MSDEPVVMLREPREVGHHPANLTGERGEGSAGHGLDVAVPLELASSRRRDPELDQRVLVRRDRDERQLEELGLEEHHAVDSRVPRTARQ